MAEPLFHLAPGVPDAAALGAGRAADLIGAAAGGALEEEARAEVLERGRGWELVRVPLPGTGGADGRPRGRPRGAGTGHLWLWRWHRSPAGERLAARLLPPRSTSPAARAWNVFCLLRGAGVATPELLAFAEEPSPLGAVRSALCVRAPDDAPTLEEIAARGLAGEERARIRREVEATLKRVAAAGVRLPRLRPRDLFVREPRAGGSPVPGLAVARRPAIVVCSVLGARVGRGGQDAQARRLIERAFEDTLLR